MEQQEQAGAAEERVCAKCGHRQWGGEECESCDIIFRKVEEREERRKSREERTTLAAYPEEGRSGGLGRFLMVAVLIGLTAGLTYFFTAKRSDAPVHTQAPPPLDSGMDSRPRPAPDRTGPGTGSPVAAQPQPLPTGTGANRIEQARNATVSVLTPWGQGSGFFILDTYIITNKHVVQADPQQVAERRQKIEAARKLANVEEQRLARLRQELGRIPDGPERRQGISLLQEREAELARFRAQLAESEEELRRVSQPLAASDIRIRFADGREQSIHAFRLSSRNDLALLLVTMPHDTVLQPAGEKDWLSQGDRVYAIGNPRGLSHTVTSGVFSGYREKKETGEMMLQTDAPINPGNSGGPLIDEQGRVHGVNTMILSNTQGIGFAIPIKTVFDDFGLVAP